MDYNGIAFTDELFDGQSYSFNLPWGGTITALTDKTLYRKQYVVFLYSVSESYYNYMRMLNQLNEGNFTGNLADIGLAEPIRVYSNVEGGTGILGGLAVSVFADHLPARKMYWLLSIFGLSLLPPALIFAVVKTPTVCFGVLLVSLAIAEIGCSIFSVWGLCAIQERTPTEFTGKVMAFVLTISQCAQPLAQFLYGVLWDYFSAAIVLATTGVLVFLIACLSRNIFRGLVLKTG